MGLRKARSCRSNLPYALSRWIPLNVRLYKFCKNLTDVFFICYFSRWIYASTLAYIVDANPGRSSTIVATNSVFRCVFAFVAIEVAIPIQVCPILFSWIVCSCLNSVVRLPLATVVCTPFGAAL